MRGQLLEQKHSCSEQLHKLENQGKLFHENIGALGAYSGQETRALWQGEENFSEFAAEELRGFTKSLQIDYRNSVEKQRKAQEKLEKNLQNLQMMRQPLHIVYLICSILSILMIKNLSQLSHLGYL